MGRHNMLERVAAYYQGTEVVGRSVKDLREYLEFCSAQESVWTSATEPSIRCCLWRYKPFRK